jgi:hypothetical protein
VGIHYITPRHLDPCLEQMGERLDLWSIVLAVCILGLFGFAIWLMARGL